MARRASFAAAAALALLVSAASLAHAAAHAQLTVFAASSLTDVFPRIDRSPRYSFGGSNTLAAQIEQGAPADVFASANTKLPAQLFTRGLCAKPVVFARNALVVVVPASNPASIRSVSDLAKPHVKVVIAADGVPVGSYTLQVLARLHLTAAVLKNVVSREGDVRGVLAKVSLGEADAGFVYATDARTVRAKVRLVQVPARAEPQVRYALCVVSSSPRKSDAQRFVDRTLGKGGQAKLVAAGFLPK